MITTFVYKAKKGGAETVMGEIKANSQDEAVDLINKLGLLPVSVEELAQGFNRPREINAKNIRPKDVFLFTRHLANLLRSSVPIPKALLIIEDQTSHATLKRLIAQLSWEIKNGRSFSESLALYPQIFPSLYFTMVKAGEESGNLQAMLGNIASYHKRQEDIISKIKMAITYPLFMTVVGTLTVLFILAFVFPRMSGLFQSMGHDLPLPTVILLNISRILSQWGWGIFCIIIIIIYAIKHWAQTASGRFQVSRLMLHLPVYGEIILKTELSRFCRTLNLLGQGGVSFIKALEIAIPLINNQQIKLQLYKSAEVLTTGGSLGGSLQQIKEIPPMIGQLISVGEESGNLNNVFLEIAENYEQETDEKIKMLMTLLEPLMILAIGAVIGLIVFAMLLPIFQIDIMAH